MSVPKSEDHSEYVAGNSQGKKKFNKRKFLEMKFDKKRKVQQWEENRQKFIMRKYKKELKKSKINPAESLGGSTTTPVDDAPKIKNTPRKGSIKSALLEIQQKKTEQRLEKEAKSAKKKEVTEAIEKYKKRKAEKFKKLSKKTKKGQPVMKERMELLYEEIKQKFGKDS